MNASRPTVTSSFSPIFRALDSQFKCIWDTDGILYQAIFGPDMDERLHKNISDALDVNRKAAQTVLTIPHFKLQNSLENKQAHMAKLRLSYHTSCLDAWSHARFSVSHIKKNLFDNNSAECEGRFNGQVRGLFMNFKELHNKLTADEMKLLKETGIQLPTKRVCSSINVWSNGLDKGSNRYFQNQEENCLSRKLTGSLPKCSGSVLML